MQLNHKLRVLGMGLLMVCVLPLSHAHGPRGYYGYRHGGWGPDPWLAPLIVGGAVVGSSIYWSRPYPPVPPSTVIITSPPAVVVNTAPVPTTEAYYCRDSGQYFPMVQTCPTPWLVVNAQPQP